jgi:hypothetical protein
MTIFSLEVRLLQICIPGASVNLFASSGHDGAYGPEDKWLTFMATALGQKYGDRTIDK